MTTVSEALSRQLKDRVNPQPIHPLKGACLMLRSEMDKTHFKMNPSKTEFIYFGFSKQLSKCTIEKINIVGDLIPRTNIIKYLGIWMDSGLTYKTHM